MEFKILKEKKILDAFFNVYEAIIEHDTYAGHQKNKVTRVALDRGDSVAVLIYEKNTDHFLFTEQFRYPSSRRSVPYILELVAGAVDANEHAEEAAKRETYEEIGYKINEIELIHKYFPSPGMSSEVINLYYAEVNSIDQHHKGGGSLSEKEDIKLIKLSRKRALQELKEKAFNNSITIMGLQWFLLNKNQD